ncbi:inactive hydroxysteroid dehydrogenase-like protein 1 [Macrobrachium nipponense]|uniref:inactive hydroxysteroid dehydrogenase-like protein 1 n=1 Tax=Macrobrachium nipponense TaxID=159736 RepID=UPI0030C8173E
MSLIGDNGDDGFVFYIIGKIAVAVIVLKMVWMVCRFVFCHDISKLYKTNLKKKYGGWAVVTGSTDGIGKAYAHELAESGLNIVLISRTLVKLDEVAQEIRVKHNVEVEVIQADFSNGRMIYDHIADKVSKKDVGILVNNVGVFATPSKFENITEDEIWNQIIVNVASVPAMSKMVLPGMLARKRGLIVNVGSLSAVAPFPYFQVYAATKAFVRSFSKGLEFEYRGTGVDVQTVLPGVVATNMAAWNKAFSKPSLSVPTPTKFARDAVATIGYASETAGYWNHEMQLMLAGILPEWVATRSAEYLIR